VKGHLVGQASLATGVTLALLPQADPPMSSSSHVRITTLSGRDQFEFRDVPAGKYTIYVADISPQPSRNLQLPGGPARWRAPGEGSGPSQIPVWGQVDVDVVEQDALDVLLVTYPLISVTGRVIADSQLPTPSLPQMISLVPDGRNSGVQRSAPVQQDGSFRIEGLVPGAHFIHFSGTEVVQSASVQSAPLRGSIQLVAGQPTFVEISVTSGGQLFGRVATATPVGGESLFVVYFPDDPQLWREVSSPETRSGRLGVRTDGSYETQMSLPPGRYRVIALSDSAAATWQSEDFRRLALNAATTVEVGSGARVRLDLRLSKLVVR